MPAKSAPLSNSRIINGLAALERGECGTDGLVNDWKFTAAQADAIGWVYREKLSVDTTPHAAICEMVRNRIKDEARRQMQQTMVANGHMGVAEQSVARHKGWGWSGTTFADRVA